jgi:hypothetical protein
MTGDIVVADHSVASMNELAARLDATLWKILESFWEGKLLVERREFVRGSALLQKTLDSAIKPAGGFAMPSSWVFWRKY